MASIAAKSAAANARLAQDSRDAAAALLAELRSRREASKEHRQKLKSSQQLLRSGSVAEGASIPVSMAGLASNAGASASSPAASKATKPS